ncbi:hypothetical protein [Staphylococcus pasteuri]|uniref:hypothetical protein n=1 Tax=Staphylococcus pasteuri TaxID=45972 RepID=UPI001C3F91C3|nr:hypothetical protein [Staphylococcus pasteuri]
MLEDIKKAKWNFITLVLSIISFTILKKTSDNFVIEFGKKVKISNLLRDGYLSSTMQILGLIFTTIVLLAITLFLCFKFRSVTSIFQGIIAIILIISTLSISIVPYLGTLILLVSIVALIFFIANDI